MIRKIRFQDQGRKITREYLVGLVGILERYSECAPTLNRLREIQVGLKRKGGRSVMVWNAARCKEIESLLDRLESTIPANIKDRDWVEKETRKLCVRLRVKKCADSGAGSDKVKIGISKETRDKLDELRIYFEDDDERLFWDELITRMADYCVENLG